MDKLHFKSKHGIILYDSSQIAVDYDEDALQNEDDPYEDDPYQDDQDKVVKVMKNLKLILMKNNPSLMTTQEIQQHQRP